MGNENNNENTKQQPQDLNQILKNRREKLANLQAEGKDPFQIILTSWKGKRFPLPED